jgi:hypothetical protein
MIEAPTLPELMLIQEIAGFAPVVQQRFRTYFESYLDHLLNPTMPGVVQEFTIDPLASDLCDAKTLTYAVMTYQLLRGDELPVDAFMGQVEHAVRTGQKLEFRVHSEGYTSYGPKTA